MFEWLFGRSFDPEQDYPSLDGKVILVTGGNAGLGKETILQLAKHHPKEIFLAARTPSKVENAIEEIKRAVPGSNISYIELDLTSFMSVREVAVEFDKCSDRLDTLVNNAVPYSKIKEGYEIQFGTNHLGHALLTKLLLPTLLTTAEKPGSDIRVLDLSSEAHYFAPGIIYDQDQLESYHTFRRYATALHPGVIMTNLYAPQIQSNPLAKFALQLINVFFNDVPNGVKNSLWAATGPKDEVRKSYYWKPVGIASQGSIFYVQKEVLARELWNWTEEQFKKHD